jgi:adhesin/invasin
MNIKPKEMTKDPLGVGLVTHNIIIWLLIISQLMIPSLITPSVFASEPPAAAFPDAGALTTAATMLSKNSEQNIAQQAGTEIKTRIASQTANSIEEWLSHLGTARVQLSVDQNGNWDQSSGDILAPLYDNKESLLFAQLGLRAPDSRVTANMGLGIRTFYLRDWMFGANVFLDDDFTGQNRRIGLGGEAWTNYLKLSANSYLATSQWHDSRDFDNEEEKAADGFDLRAEGYLPAQPQLGMKMVYEQYYGNKVALFDTDHLQSNPSAVTLGVNYTPVPLITLATNYRRGQDNLDDVQFQVDFHYDFAHDWRYQLSSENVALERSLAGSRTDLVERNNQIVMQYRDKKAEGVGKLVLQPLNDHSPADGKTQNRLQVQVFNTKNEAMSNTGVLWASNGQAVLDSSASVTDANGFAFVTLTDASSEIVNVTATSGNVSAQTQSSFDKMVPATLVMKIDSNNSVADGVATDNASVKVEDSQHNAVANATIEWAVSVGATLRNAEAKTNVDGVAHAQIVSTTAGEYTLTAKSGGLSQQGSVTFVANDLQAAITQFALTQDRSPANGTTANKALITVEDPSGNPVVDTPVTLSATSTTVAFSSGVQRTASSMRTDAQGQVHLRFTDTAEEKVQLTAALKNGNTKTLNAEFIGDESSAALQRLTVTNDGSPADGHSQNSAEVYVMDGNNNPLQGQTVSWKADKPDVHFALAGKSDQNGKATITYTSTTAQTLTLSASLANGSKLSAPSSFNTDENSLQIATFDVTTGAVANGSATNTASITVTDASHNPAANETANWQVDGAAKLASPTGQTDAQGKLSVTFSDTKAEKVNVKVTLAKNSASQTKASKFIADSSSAVIDSLDATKTALANGFATNTAHVVVVDANNNPVADAHISWHLGGSAQPGQTESSTNAKGLSSITFTDTVAQEVDVTATLDNTNSKQTKSLFISDPASATVALSLGNDNSLADGATTNTINAVVKDGQGNPLPAQTITWQSNRMTAQMPASSKTDLQGHSQITVTDVKGESVTVTATLANQVSTNIDTHFVSYQVTGLAPDMTQQQADGKSPITFTATLKDNAGNPISGQKIAFSTTSLDARLSDTQPMTNASGQAIVTLMDSKEESVTVTAKSQGWSADTGKASTVAFKSDHITGMTANGHDFTMSDKFPTIGMLNASFTMKINDSTASNSHYTWTSDASWLAFRNPGEAVFVSKAATKTATITATPVSGTGPALTYTFTLNHWVLNIARSNINPSVADDDCASNGATTPSYSFFSSGKEEQYGSRGMGTFYGEWGNPKDMLGNQWSTSSTAESMWASETGSNGTRIYVNWRNGYVNNNPPTQEMDEVCLVY